VKISILAVGKIKQPGLRAELDDYLGRIRRYAPCDEVELKDGSERELTERFARTLPPRSLVVALEAGGRAYDSAGFASFLGRCQRDAVPSLAFLIGGAYGLPDGVVQQASQRLSLSRLTLPHRLARLVLAEQIYRGFTILRGEPYAH
jgi:23S rRNA (pseudouridine1915-N3)-methyltransferase